MLGYITSIAFFREFFVMMDVYVVLRLLLSDDNLKNISMSIANISPCKMPYGGENDSWLVTGGEEVCPTHPLIPHHLHPASVCLNVAL